jgi:hypothetical protein
MDDGYLHSDALLVKHLLARMTPSEREPILSTLPEVQRLQHANAMLWLRIGQCGNEGRPDLDLWTDGEG